MPSSKHTVLSTSKQTASALRHTLSTSMKIKYKIRNRRNTKNKQTNKTKSKLDNHLICTEKVCIPFRIHQKIKTCAIPKQIKSFWLYLYVYVVCQHGIQGFFWISINLKNECKNSIIFYRAKINIVSIKSKYFPLCCLLTDVHKKWVSDPIFWWKPENPNWQCFLIFWSWYFGTLLWKHTF